MNGQNIHLTPQGFIGLWETLIMKVLNDFPMEKIVTEHKLTGCPKCGDKETTVPKEMAVKISTILNKESGRVEQYRMCRSCSVLWVHAKPGKCCGDCAFKPNSRERQEGDDPASAKMFLCHTRVPFTKKFTLDYENAPEVRMCEGFARLSLLNGV